MARSVWHLLVGLLTYSLSFEQCVLPVHPVFGQLQLHFEHAQLGLQGSVIDFGQNIAFIDVGAFGKIDGRDFS